MLTKLLNDNKNNVRFRIVRLVDYSIWEQDGGRVFLSDIFFI